MRVQVLFSHHRATGFTDSPSVLGAGKIMLYQISGLFAALGYDQSSLNFGSQAGGIISD
jgi:hypothetical protein